MTVGGAIARPLSPLGRWLMRRLWWVEHAFERARASDKAVDDTRLRIFFVLALFAAGFVTLALGADAGGAVLALRPRRRAAGAGAERPRRPGRPQRRSAGASICRTTASTSIRTRWCTRPTIRARAAARRCRPIAPRQARHASWPATSASILIGGLTPEQQRPDPRPRPAGRHLRGGERPRLSAGHTAAHLIGFADKDGAAWPAPRRRSTRRSAPTPATTPVALSIDLRVQGALEDELDRPRPTLQAVGARRHRGQRAAPARSSAWPATRASTPTTPAHADPDDHDQPRRRHGLRAGLGVQGVHPGHGPRLRRRHARHHVRRRTRRWCCRGQTIHDYDKGDASLTLCAGVHPLVQHRRRAAGPAGRRAERMDRYFRGFGLFAAAPSELAESARPLLPRALIAQHRRLDVVRPRHLGQPAGDRHRHERDPRTAASTGR